MSRGLKGWHPGEAAIQMQLRYSTEVADAHELFTNALPDEERNAYSRVVFLPVVALDVRGRPWVSILTSPNGTPGIISSPKENLLMVKCQPWQGDPLYETCLLVHGQDNPLKPLVAGSTLSTNLETHKGPRTKFSGVIDAVHKIGTEWLLKLEVKQAMPGGNSKFMTTRQLIPHESVSPTVVFQQLELKPSDRLPQEIIDFILSQDAIYFGTYYAAAKKDEKDFPSHLGFNIRSGFPGFARVRITDGRTVIFPDYPGNHLMNSLGNIETTPVAAMTIPCYKTGNILYLTGTARNHVGKRARMLMPRVQVLTTMKVMGYVFVKNAIPLRERPELTKFSSACPPLRVLTEEKSTQKSHKHLSAQLVSMSLKSPNLGVFRFKLSSPISIGSGDWVQMNFAEALQRAGRISEFDPKGEDFFRTWTVTSFSPSPVDEFELTIQKQSKGLVTGYLFDIGNQTAAPSVDPPLNMLPLSIPVIASGGDFALPTEKTSLLWIAGGIGITPFISLFKHILSLTELGYDIALVFCTSTPQVHLPLFLQSLETVSPSDVISHRVGIHVFSNAPFSPGPLPSWISLKPHPGRFSSTILNEINDINTRDISICAPPGLARLAVESIMDLGVLPQFIRQETFSWFF